jgi:hypothetical protein
MDYPSADRQSCGFAVRYLRWLCEFQASLIGPNAVAVLTAIVTFEDQLHYSRAPDFTNGQLLNRTGIKSVHALITARDRAIEEGLLFYREGTRSKPGRYYVTGFDAQNAVNNDSDSVRKAHRKRNERAQKVKRTRTHLTHTQLPIPNSTSFPLTESLGSNNEFDKAWKDWLQHLKEKKKSPTPTAMQKQLAKCEAWGPARSIAAIENSIAGNYQGLYEPTKQIAKQSSNEDRPELQRFNRDERKQAR